jgi:predicted RNA-binding Zn-ribbon protein involved in translation (DUF1610 family)
MDCEFEQQGKEYVCVNCGFTTPITDLHIRCKPGEDRPKPAPVPPSLIKRSKNLSKAIAKHMRTGRRHCTDEQKEARFQQCSSNECGLFLAKGKKGTAGVCAHEDCGCIIRSRGKFLDKLSWADSECPEGYWGPIPEKDEETPENGV